MTEQLFYMVRFDEPQVAHLNSMYNVMSLKIRYNIQKVY